MTPFADIAAVATGSAAVPIGALMLLRWWVGRRPHTGTRAIDAPRPRPATVTRKDVKGEPPWPPIVDADPEWLAELAGVTRTPPPPTAPTVAHLLPPPPAHSPDWADLTAPRAAIRTDVPQPREDIEPVEFTETVPESKVLARAWELLGVRNG